MQCYKYKVCYKSTNIPYAAKELKEHPLNINIVVGLVGVSSSMIAKAPGNPPERKRTNPPNVLGKSPPKVLPV
jgi:hypothetical protein